MLNCRGSSEMKEISQYGLKRLAQEVIRQAVYDYGDPNYQKEVTEFFQSEWAGELADLHGGYPTDALHRLEIGAINTSDFYSGAGPSLEKYIETKSSRRPGPLLLGTSFTQH